MIPLWKSPIATRGATRWLQGLSTLTWLVEKIEGTDAYWHSLQSCGLAEVLTNGDLFEARNGERGGMRTPTSA